MRFPGTALLSPLLFAVILLFGSESLAAPDPSPASLYNEANRLYKEGNYQEAASTYTELASKGVTNGYLFYNLGNAYFKQGAIGKTILWYSRAKTLLPRDNDVATNLEFARRVRPDKIEEMPLPRLVVAVRDVIFGLNLSELTLTAFLLYLLTAAAFVAFFLSREPSGRRVIGRIAAVLGIVLAVSLLWLGGRIYHADRTVGCVVMVSQVDAMSGPGNEYTKVISLHEGAEALVQEEREGWYLIKLSSGLGGWIPRESVELL
jgi:tetratricopeptide (TPR) repeat protein